MSSLRAFSRALLIAALSLFLSAGSSSLAFASEPETALGEVDDITQLSLEDLLGGEIETASRKKEDRFLSPVSSSVITHEQIMASGATTIPEAMRLLPGVMVRETNTGHSWVHIRGLENVQHTGFIPLDNKSTLVMVDERIIFDYLWGGTFWEDVPVDLQDIERIELIRSPVTALYGPNAVSGVINIVTRKLEEDGQRSAAHLEGGFSQSYTTTMEGEEDEVFPHSRRLAARTELREGDFRLGLNAHHIRKDRSTGQYFSLREGAYVDDPATLEQSIFGTRIENARSLYSDIALGLERTAANANVSYMPEPGEKEITLLGGMARSKSQYAESGSDLHGYSSFLPRQARDYYADLRAKAHGFFLHSTLRDYDFDSANGEFVYNNLTNQTELSYVAAFDTIEIRPGVSYHFFDLDSSFVENKSIRAQFLTGSLRADASFLDAFRAIAAVSGTWYDHKEDTIHPDWQASALWEINDDNVLRLGYGRASRSIFLLDVYAHVERSLFSIQGNRDLDPMTADTFEVGYRARPAEWITVDTEAFFTLARDFRDLAMEDDPEQPGLEIINKTTQTEYTQAGFTASVEMVPLSNLFLRAYGTLQFAWVKDRQMRELLTISVGDDEAHEATPALFGGVSADYQALSEVHLHVDLFGYTGHTLAYPNASLEVDPNVLINLKVGYDLLDGVSAYLAGRNLSIQGEHRQAVTADVVVPQAFAGFTGEW